mmetsp:Transcript_27532/g.69695  ORF Transcript_27532/g.69695 Transcript_27532/m.69695 type:complete len:265 (+) Transcript_27532:94-888(+)
MRCGFAVGLLSAVLALDSALDLQDIDDIMKRVDTDKDGKLSWSEILQHSKDQRQSDMDEATKSGGHASMVQEAFAWDEESETNVKDLFKAADKDGDGHISATELPSMVQEEDEDQDRPGEEETELEEGEEGEDAEDGEDSHEHEDEATDPHEDMREFLKLADTNKDGKLSLEEVKASAQEGTEKQDGRIDEEFKVADLNKDGLLDEKELMSLHMDESEEEDEEGDHEEDERWAAFMEEEGHDDTEGRGDGKKALAMGQQTVVLT